MCGCVHACVCVFVFVSLTTCVRVCACACVRARERFACTQADMVKHTCMRMEWLRLVGSLEL